VPGWLTTLRGWVADASPLRRVMLALLVVLPFAALGLASYILQPADYRVLYPKLSDRASGEVLAALDQFGIAYRLSPADGGIEVPAEAVHLARYRLAAQGLPRSDEAVRAGEDAAPRFGASSQQEQQRLQRVLEQELARSVEALGAVERARVHLALPRASPFLRDAPPATAAVLVRTGTGSRLSAEQVATIQTLVSASVPRLLRSDVQVFDPEGLVPGAAEPAAESPRAALERELAARARDVLAPWLGADRVNVQVAATLDDSETRRTVERVRTTVVAGQPRPLEKIVQTTVLPEGRLLRFDALVILGFDAPPEVRQRAEQLARQALGFTPSRGDTLRVYVLPDVGEAEPEPVVATTEVAPPALALEQSARTISPPVAPSDALTFDYRLASAAVAALVLLVAVAWAWTRARRTRTSVPDEPVDDFDAQLEAARRQSLDNPRVTADVIKLWMRA